MGRPSGVLETGVLYCDDNLDRMRKLPAESVDLVYLDPPFFSNRVYEVIWGEEAEVRSFADRWEGGMQVYIKWMRSRVLELHRLLKPTGTVYLHCDGHASHYLKVMMDEIFGYNTFRNEIVWQRTLAKSLSTVRLPNNHDCILSYSKSDRPTWNNDTMFQKYDEENLDGRTASKYRYISPSGRLYRLDSLINPNPNRPNLTYEFLGVTRVWRWTQDRMQRAYDDGLIVQSKPGRVPQLKRYLDEQRGRPLGDVWTDIAPLNSRAAERLGYPTQKPEALLARIIGASSNPGDVVLDPFCGCGTTISVAQKMGRQWVGIDISPTAMTVMDRRIKAIPGAASPTLIGIPDTVERLRKLKPFEFQNWVIQQFCGVGSPRKSGDMGIDGYTYLSRDPIQIKRSDKVGRNVVDNFQTAIRRDKSTTGWLVAFSFTRDAKEEVARALWEDKIEINLITVDQMLLPKAERRGPVWPEPASVLEFPLNPPRDPKDVSFEELVASETLISA